MKLDNIQIIAKEYKIDINYINNNKTINKTKKMLIEEILSI